MADAISVDPPAGEPDKTLQFSTGKLAGQADGAVTVQIGDTVVLVTATAAKSARRRRRLLPAHRRHRRAHVRRRQDPRLVLPP